MDNEFGLHELGAIDDFLTDSFVDKVYFLTRSRKVYCDSVQDLNRLWKTGPNRKTITAMLRKYITVRKSVHIDGFVSAYMQLPEPNEFLRTKNLEPFRDIFIAQLKRYLGMFRPDNHFDISTTDRFMSANGGLVECCVIARKHIPQGTWLRNLDSIWIDIQPHEENEIASKDFSLFQSPKDNSKSRIMLGPTRFVNHDCEANTRFVLKGQGISLVTTRGILPGEEITSFYSKDYFGVDNVDCLCQTCQRTGRISSDSRSSDSSASGERSVSPDREQSLTRRLRRQRRAAVDSILEVYPKDTSLDELACFDDGSPQMEYELGLRRMNRILHKQYWSRIYRDDADKKNIFNCRNCGVYCNQTWCPRCVRHARLYRLEWPECKPTGHHVVIAKTTSASVAEVERYWELIHEIEKAEREAQQAAKPVAALPYNKMGIAALLDAPVEPQVKQEPDTSPEKIMREATTPEANFSESESEQSTPLERLLPKPLAQRLKVNSKRKRNAVESEIEAPEYEISKKVASTEYSPFFQKILGTPVKEDTVDAIDFNDPDIIFIGSSSGQDTDEDEVIVLDESQIKSLNKDVMVV